MKHVELWGGPLDGKTVRLPHDAESYRQGRLLYRPMKPGDYATNRFRYEERISGETERD